MLNMLSYLSRRGSLVCRLLLVDAGPADAAAAVLQSVRRRVAVAYWGARV